MQRMKHRWSLYYIAKYPTPAAPPPPAAPASTKIEYGKEQAHRK